MFAPTKIWRKWHVKISKGQKRFATCSALAATAITSLVLARGHRIAKIPEIPLVVSNEIESFTKTKQAVTLLRAIGAYGDVRKAKDSKHIRVGRGKARNRRYQMRKGPLIVYNSNDGIYNAFRNLPGVSLCNVKNLSILNLAPGSHVGRFIVWSEAAFKALNEVYGTFTEASIVKRGFTLPQPMLKNPDITKIMKDEKIRRVLKARKMDYMKKPKPINRNPLKNIRAMAKINPYKVMLRRKAAIENIKIRKMAEENKQKRLEGKKVEKMKKPKKAPKCNKEFIELLLS